MWCAVTIENIHVIRIEIEYVVRMMMEMDEGTERGKELMEECRRWDGYLTWSQVPQN